MSLRAAGSRCRCSQSRCHWQEGLRRPESPPTCFLRPPRAGSRWMRALGYDPSDSCHASTARAARPNYWGSVRGATKTSGACWFSVLGRTCSGMSGRAAHLPIGSVPSLPDGTPRSSPVPSPTNWLAPPGHWRPAILSSMRERLPCLSDQSFPSLTTLPKSTHLVLRPLKFDDVNGTPA